MQAEFEAQVLLSASIEAADPQLVLVLEAVDEQVNLHQVARKLGIEVLVEVEDDVEPNDEFVLKSSQPRNPLITSCLHAICVNETALKKLLGMWRSWTTKHTVPYGYAPLRDLFQQLKDVRVWGPQDRLKMVDWDEHFSGYLPDTLHDVEIELWYRASANARQKSENEVRRIISDADGSVTSVAHIPSIGYHGIKCQVPSSIVRDLANRRYENVQLVKSANIMYLRITGQAMPISGTATESVRNIPPVALERPPVVCLLDGIPAANHRLLRGRVVVHDPDNFESEAAVEERKHGTWMASAVAWGDLGQGDAPLSRPIMVRPVLVPSNATITRDEELPPDQLAPDLMWRTFRELFEDHDGLSPVGPEVAIINLSVGDPATPFHTLISSWARMLDWLSYEYGVLVVVSAGNYPQLPLGTSNTNEVLALTGHERRHAVLAAQQREQLNRRIFSPSESINAITVGAIHADASDGGPVGPYVADPADGLPSISPVSAFGGGYRRSLKPEMAADGGRAMFRIFPQPQPTMHFAPPTRLGPGIKVAAPGGQETFIVGTSPAAALVTRQAAKAHELLEGITRGQAITRRQRAAAIKALLVHGTGTLSDFTDGDFATEQALGNGAHIRDLTMGCATNEAVLLYVGSLGAAEEVELSFPLPDGLNVREAKRIDATLAWLSPVNWRHRQYRRASLTFVKPTGSISQLPTAAGLPAQKAMRGAATVIHQSWETQSTFAGGRGSEMTVRVKCFEQAGGLGGGRIDFAAVLSLWVAPTINVDVYAQVRAQVQSRVGIRPL